MAARAYVLIKSASDNSRKMAKILKAKPGIVMIELLEGSPDLLVVTEASDRQYLAKLTIKALASVENMTESLQLLPVQN